MAETLREWIDRQVLEMYTGPQLKTIVVTIRNALKDHYNG